MVDGNRRATLASECTVFCGYLLGQAPSTGVVAAYVRAHEVGTVEAGVSPSALDRALMSLAAAGPGRARAADAYAAILAPSCLLRRKLVLLVAILESYGTTARILDSATPGSRACWFAELFARGILGMIRVGGAAPLVLLLWIWHGLRRPDARSA